MEPTSAEEAAAAILAVYDACRAADEPAPLDEAALLLLRDAGPVGEAWVIQPKETEDAQPGHTGSEAAGFAWRHDGALELAVAPAARRRGLGFELLTTAAAVPGPLTAWSHGGHPGAAALAERCGFARTRDLWVMRRSAAVPLPDLPRSDLQVRGFRPDDAESLLAVNAAAFAGHPEQGAMSADDLAVRMAEPWFDPDGLLVAEDPDGGLLGFHWTKIAEPAVGEVYVVGVSPAAQGRGVGRLLTLAGLHHLLGRGVAEIELYVESDNAPAIAVYTGLGFTHAPADTHVQYTRGG